MYLAVSLIFTFDFNGALTRTKTRYPPPHSNAMDQVTKMLVGLAAMLMAGAVPTNLAEQKDGIISFNNVPSYAQVRRSYLDSAAACAVSAQEANAEFLLSKTLTDGTNRYTISTPSGQDADATATTTDAACPGYKTIYGEFSSLLELVVLNVATTLDATSFTTTDGYGQTVSSRKLMTDADDFSLELHEDDGMFIVFATPAFYKVNSDGTNDTLESIPAGGEDDSESGLIIQRRDGQRVRPILKPDQVTLMVGTGYNRWVGTSEQLPAVMHGMRMPEVETTETQRLLRAWFGKMTLLPSYQRMLKQMDFDVHANTTKQYVQQGHQSDHQLLGCAPGRHLLASADAECSYNSCTVKSGATAPSEGCSVCHNVLDACVLDLDSCSLDQQSCSGQAKKCDSTSAPAPAPAPTPAPAPAPTSAPTPTTTAPSSPSTPTTPSSDPSTVSAPTTPSTPSSDNTPTGASEERDAPTDGPSSTTAAPTSSTGSSSSSSTPAATTPAPASEHGVC
ncbi:hypothetical protein GQ600_13801 [Phytophthora cactorum]|nr:hypothetical protein GQ600_13801 [Phytophthora cactorum]